jgi:hypothetical protein
MSSSFKLFPTFISLAKQTSGAAPLFNILLSRTEYTNKQYLHLFVFPFLAVRELLDDISCEPLLNVLC